MSHWYLIDHYQAPEIKYEVDIYLSLFKCVVYKKLRKYDHDIMKN